MPGLPFPSRGAAVGDVCKKKYNPKTDPFWDAQIPALLILLFAALALMKPGIITSAFPHAATPVQPERGRGRNNLLKVLLSPSRGMVSGGARGGTRTLRRGSVFMAAGLARGSEDAHRGTGFV